jgi:hypothetical protein
MAAAPDLAFERLVAGAGVAEEYVSRAIAASPARSMV